MSDATVLDDPTRHDDDHVVLLYDTEQALVQSVATFLAPGLLLDEAVLVVATPEHRALFAAALTVVDPELPAHRAAGRYVELDAEETLGAFFQGGRLSPLGFNSAVGRVIRELSEQHGRVHIYGEMVACLWNRGDATTAVQLEHLWNDLARDHDFRLCCAYHSSLLLRDMEQVDGMIAAHSTTSWVDR